MAKASLSVFVAMAVVVFLSVQVKSAVAASSYMDSTEMQEAVRNEVKAYPDDRPGLIRLLFHDCFVNGCDGSVLLNTSHINGTNGKTEMTSGFNIGLRGLQVIEKIKAKLGLNYSITCTDAVIYAAREAVYLLSNGTIAYYVDGPGRKDGVISRSEDPEKSLPTPSFDFAKLKANFEEKGLSVDDAIALSGAHAVGVAHRSFFDINTVGTPASYQAAVVWEMRNGTDVIKNNVRDFDAASNSGYKDDNKTRMAAKGVLDNSFYNAVSKKMALFPSDRVLWDGAQAKVTDYMNKADMWKKDFGNAMERLSRLKGPTEAPSETRNVCFATNEMHHDYTPRQN